MVAMGSMGDVKGVDMTAGTITTDGEVLTDRGTNQSAVAIMTAGTAVMG